MPTDLAPPPSRSSVAAANGPLPGERNPVAQVATSVDAMRRIVRALRVAAQRTAGEAGISAAQLFVLQRLGQAPAQSISELGARTLTDRSSVAEVIGRLAARGLVRRTPSLDDRRRMTIAITSAGRSLLRTAPAAPTSLLMAGLEQLSAAELAGLGRGLERLTQCMGIAAESTRMLFEDD